MIPMVTEDARVPTETCTHSRMIAAHKGGMVIQKLEPGNEVCHILLASILIFLLGSTMISCAKISDLINTPQIKSAENLDKSKTPEIERADKARNIKTKEWVGHHRDELATRRGLPSHEARLAHGGRSLVYQQQGGSGNQRNPRCRTVFITDAQGIIQAAADYAC